jgi:transcriptional regulator with XRE-family HTH domain
VGKSANLLNDDQLPIAPAIQAVHKANGKRILALVGRAITANGMSLSELARETAIDNSQITRMLAGDAGLRADFVAAVMARDHLGVLVSGLCAMVGRDAVERKPDPVAENRRLKEELARLRDEVSRVLEATP